MFMSDITNDIIDDFIEDIMDDYERYRECILVILSHDEKFGALVALLLRCIDCILF